jgi:formylglycine-generating enzyme required for sulfatase activity
MSLKPFRLFDYCAAAMAVCALSFPAHQAQAAPNLEQMTIPGLNVVMVKLPKGSLIMGQPADTPNMEPDEAPPTRVNLTHDFWLGTTEITVAQWRAFTDITGYVTAAETTGEGIFLFSEKSGHPHRALSWRNPGYAQQDNFPVVGISWEDARQFCRWLTEREQSAGRLPVGYICTLPTEAQFEYAFRAGQADDPGHDDDYAWYRDNSGGLTHPVAQKKPNAWGLYDMPGNVWEWVYDWYGLYPGVDVTDYSGPASPNDRRIVLPHHEMRGGGKSNPPGHGIGSHNRWSTTGNTQNDWAGFRLALAVPPPAPAPTTQTSGPGKGAKK